MFQNFLVKQLLKSKLKSLPESEQNKIMTILEKNPDFFMKIAKEIQEKTNQGMSQEEASVAVMTIHKDELQKMLGPN